MNRLFDVISSLKLTLSLLFGLATISVVGTIWPSRDTELDVFRYELFYQSIPFRLLLLALAINLSVCTLRLLSRRLKEKQRFFDSLMSAAGGEDLPTSASPAEISSSLRELGYRVQGDDKALLARKWWFGRYSVLLVHLSLLIIMAGGMITGLGFVGTLNIYIGDATRTIFDWDAQADRVLDFGFQLDHFEPIFYPVEVKFAAIDPATGQLVREYTAIDGDMVDLPVAGWQARFEKFDPLQKRFLFQLFREGVPVASYQAEVGVKNPDNIAAGGLVLYPLAYRDPILKQYHSEVSIIEGGRTVRQAVIKVNSPLVHRGVSIFQTRFNRDPEGRVYAGFQFSKDPGEPLVWAGCILLMVGFLINLSFRPRALGLVRTDAGWRLQPLVGFRGEAGQGELDRVRGQTPDSRT